MQTPDELLSRRMASCGSVSIFEKRLPTGLPVYAVTVRGEIMAQVETWNDALIKFKELARQQTEQTLTAIQ